MKNLNYWIQAFRPKTLPLAVSGVLLAAFIAVSENIFTWNVFIAAVVTAILLQILSNLANDYGDFKKGSDKINRLGPARMVSSGYISAIQMKTAIIIIALLAFISGSLLIYSGLGKIFNAETLVFFILGLSAIAAAIKYTVGKNPYGYYGFGDFMVFLFFGLLGVMGTFYMFSGYFKMDLLLPATSVGLLSAGVLNINNLRDYENDKIALKRTVVVMLGIKRARLYHFILISGAFLLTFLYAVINFNNLYQFLFFIALPFFIWDINTVFSFIKPVELNTELKRLALTTLLFSAALGFGCILNIK